MKNNYNHTMRASYIGYIVQAIVNTFMPLLYVTFGNSYGISLDKISLLITLNFGTQLVIDFLSSQFVDKIGYKISVVGAHLLAATGLVLMSVLPNAMTNHYAGILISMVFCSVGGGLIEVVVSPIVEACPCDNKESHMSLLHSFYCWGHVMVVLVSTGYFSLFGIENWRYLSLAFALVPLFNAFYYMIVPIRTLEENDGEESMPLKVLSRKKIFWIMMLLMVCSGACELAVSQWASAFAEKGLGISKTLGDLAGPLSFAVLMGISRVVYAKISHKVSLEKYMLASCVLCFVSYLITSLSPIPALSLIGCAMCGFSVGVMWPGTYSLAAKEIKGGGTAMFAILALAGDFGCSTGPTLVGFVSEAAGENLEIGILTASVFSLLMIFGVIFCIREKNKQ